MIKAIAFDKDGTLMDYDAFWGPVAEQTARKALEIRGYSTERIENMCELLGSNAGIRRLLFHASYAQLTLRFNEAIKKLDPKFIPFDTAELESVFKSCVVYGQIKPLCENIGEVLKTLKENGLVFSLITQDTEQNSRNCLKALGIEEYFDVIYGDDGINPTKPDPYYMNKFYEDYDLRPHEVLMVGDMPTDMLFAQNSGAVAVGIAKSAKDKAALADISDRLIENISELEKVIRNS